MEIRTPDPLVANEVLYQLSYRPLSLYTNNTNKRLWPIADSQIHSLLAISH